MAFVSEVFHAVLPKLQPVPENTVSSCINRGKMFLNTIHDSNREQDGLGVGGETRGQKSWRGRRSDS